MIDRISRSGIVLSSHVTDATLFPFSLLTEESEYKKVIAGDKILQYLKVTRFRISFCLCLSISLAVVWRSFVRTIDRQTDLRRVLSIASLLPVVPFRPLVFPSTLTFVTLNYPP